MTRRLLIPALVTLFSLAILVSLGAWQWRRMGEKEALIATIGARGTMTPQAMLPPGETIDPADVDFRPVILRGAFVGDDEAHVFFSVAKPINGVGGPGYLVIKPFRLEDGRQVLVNRGFVPQHQKQPASRPGSDLSGPLTITGVLRLPEKRTMFSGADDPVKNIYYIRDAEAIARGMRLARITGDGRVVPYIVDLTSPVPAGGLPMPVVTQIQIPNNHFQYALTWWSLALVLAAIFGIFARQQRQQSGDASPPR